MYCVSIIQIGYSLKLQRYQAYKHHWSDIRLPTVLEITPYSLDQLDPATNKVLASYYYKDFEGICTVSDLPGIKSLLTYCLDKFIENFQVDL